MNAKEIFALLDGNLRSTSVSYMFFTIFSNAQNQAYNLSLQLLADFLHNSVINNISDCDLVLATKKVVKTFLFETPCGSFVIRLRNADNTAGDNTTLYLEIPVVLFLSLYKHFLCETLNIALNDIKARNNFKSDFRRPSLKQYTYLIKSLSQTELLALGQRSDVFINGSLMFNLNVFYKK